MSVFDKVKELASEINQSVEYRNLLVSKQNLDRDEVASKLLKDMIIMQEEYVKTLRQNIDKDAVDAMEKLLKNKHQELLDNSITHEYIKAKAVFDQLMKDINKQLKESIKAE